MLFFGMFLRESARTAVKSRTINLSTNSGKVQIHLGMDIQQTNCPSRHKGHLGVLGGQTFKSLEKLSNGWNDRHQLWFTSADSSGNGHRLNTIRPSIARGAFWGVTN